MNVIMKPPSITQTQQLPSSGSFLPSLLPTSPPLAPRQRVVCNISMRPPKMEGPFFRKHANIMITPKNNYQSIPNIMK